MPPDMGLKAHDVENTDGVAVQFAAGTCIKSIVIADSHGNRLVVCPQALVRQQVFDKWSIDDSKWDN